jgi:subtilisin family serine protease/squalene cyclase
MADVNLNVISQRLLDALRAPGMEASDASVPVLLRFKDEASLRAFVADPSKVLAKLGATADSLQIERVMPELNYVSATIQARTIAPLSTVADDVGVTVMDSNPSVMALAAAAQPAAQSAAPPSPPHTGVFGLTGRGIKVAVLDTGIDGTHPDLVGRVARTQDFSGGGAGDKVGHGTHCAGLIAGRGVQDATRRALAYEADLIDVKVLGNDGGGRTDAIMAGIVWAVSQAGADILSLSLGTSGNFDGTEALSEAVAWAVDKGACVVVAAGNCGPAGSEIACVVRGPRSITSPGVCEKAVSVGASDQDQSVAAFSSCGPTAAGLVKPDLLLPGADVVSTLATGVTFGHAVDGFYTRASGTSMATPQGAAIAALLLQAAQQRTVKLAPKDVKSIMMRAAKAIDNVGATLQGSGTLDPADAVSLFLTENPPPQAAQAGPTLDLAVTPDDGASLRVGSPARYRVTVRNQSQAAIENVQVTVGASNARLQTQGAAAVVAAHLDPNATASEAIVVTPSAAGDVSVTVYASYRDAAGAVATTTRFFGLTPAVPGAPVTLARVSQVVAKASDLLLAAQRPGGNWAGDIMFNAWTNGMYCILHKILKLQGEPTAALDWLSTHRAGLDETGTADGTFGIVDPPSIHMLEATVVAEVALEIWGRPRDQRAWDFLQSLSAARLADAISNADPFTQTFISLGSAFRPHGVEPYYSMADIMIPPVELLAIPSFVGASVPNLFAAWGLDAVSALAIIGVSYKEKYPTLAHRVLLAKAERQLLRNQRPDGSWYGTILPTFACTLAMHMLGYANDHPVMQAAFGFMHGQLRSDGYLVRYELPVWDTALSIIALREAGLPPTDPRLLRGADYLMSAQAPSGGVPFKRENAIYPDCDDTAYAILALDLVTAAAPAQKQAYTNRALEWLLYMQGNTGGWAAFSKDQSVKSPDRAPMFKDDPPTADVTGHTLSALKLARGVQWGDRVQDSRQRGFDWLHAQQLPSGGFYGRWGMTVTYGTTAVLQAVADLGEPTDQPLVTASVAALLAMQKGDGGWGEGYRTYYNVNATESVPSTVEQTAWSILGLMAVPMTPDSRKAVESGVAFLLDRFDPVRGWGEGSYCVGALWIYKHSLYPLAWPLWALAKYAKVAGSVS